MPENDALYIDSCCFIDAVRIDLSSAQTRAQYTKQELEDAVWIKQTLTAARDGAIRAYTSGLTIAECSTIEKGQSEPPENVKQLFRSMLLSNKVVSLVEPDIFLCEDARDLRWNHGLVLSGADAIHVATAIQKKCAELITTDSRILKKHAEVFAKFQLRIVRPVAATLPDHYRQHQLPWGGSAPTKRARRKKGRT